MRIGKLAVAACLLLFGSTGAVAADSGLYIDVGGGLSQFQDADKSRFAALLVAPNITVQSDTIDDQGSSWSVGIGYRISRYFAAEFGYMDLGAVKYRANIIDTGFPALYKATVSSKGPTLSAMGMLPLGKKFEVRARAGVIFAITKFNDYEQLEFVNGEFSIDDSSRDIFMGVSAAFKLTKTLSVHLGVDRFNKVGDSGGIGDSNVDTVNLGLTISQ